MCSSHRAGCPAHHGHETKQVSSGLCGCLVTRQLGKAGGRGGPAPTPGGGGPAPGPALTPRGRTGRRPRLRSCSRCARSAHTGPARTGRTPRSRPRPARTTSRLSTLPQPGLCRRNTGQSNGDWEPWRWGLPLAPRRTAGCPPPAPDPPRVNLCGSTALGPVHQGEIPAGFREAHLGLSPPRGREPGLALPLTSCSRTRQAFNPWCVSQLGLKSVVHMSWLNTGVPGPRGGVLAVTRVTA